MSDRSDPASWAAHQSDFGARSTFAGVRAVKLDEVERHQVVILGAPFDWGTSYRPGTRFGPKAIREADYLGPDGTRPHVPTGIDPLAVLEVVDAGDLLLAPGYVEEGLERIIGAVEHVVGAGALPIVLGGDHTITYANGTGVANALGHGRVALVHFDAHADTGEHQWGHLYGHGTPMRRLVESGAVPGGRFVQIGLRGYWPSAETFSWMADQGMRWYTMSDLSARGLELVVDEAVSSARSGGADGVFLSVDIDVVDPGMAPGTGTPEPGGMTSRELLDTVRRLSRELPIVGADIVEVSPPYDGPGQITAFLANRVVMEVLNGLAEQRTTG